MNPTHPVPDPSEIPAPQPTTPLTPRDTVRQLVYGLGLAAKDHIAMSERLLADPPQADFDQRVTLPPGKTREEHLGALRKFIRQLRALDMEADERFREMSQAPFPRREEHRSCLADIEGRIQRFLPRFRFNWNVLMETAAAADYILDSMKECLAEPGSRPAPGGPLRGLESKPALRLERLEDLMRMPVAELETRMQRIRALLQQSQEAAPPIASGDTYPSVTDGLPANANRGLAAGV